MTCYSSFSWLASGPFVTHLICGYLCLGKTNNFSIVQGLIFLNSMTSETKNWAIVAAAFEVQGSINSLIYQRAKAMTEGKADPMTTSYPAAPHSISIA